MTPSWRQRLVGVLMLPLTLVPFGVYVNATPEGRLLWAKAVHPLAAPDLPMLPAGETAWLMEHAPRYSGGAAVLVYHGLGGSVSEEATQTMTPEEFGEQLVALDTAGLETITANEFVEACQGGDPLPENAVMITFDDGRTEAMMHAAPLLQQAGMVATMFIITSEAEEPSLFYADWHGLEEYAASGTWELQSHTDALHATLPVLEDAPVDQRPMLVNRLPDEELAGWRDRVEDDLATAEETLTAHTGREPVAFAYPFGAHGGDARSNDKRIAAELRELVAEHADVAFQQDDQDSVDLADCDDDQLMLRRLDVGAWSGIELVERIGRMAQREGESHA